MDRLSRLPEYQCHKVVKAAKIVGLINPPVSQLELDPEDGGPTIWHEVPGEFMVRSRPQIGGYLVVYEGGYQSWSPAEAFEQGYTKVVPEELGEASPPMPAVVPELVPVKPGKAGGK